MEKALLLFIIKISHYDSLHLISRSMNINSLKISETKTGLLKSVLLNQSELTTAQTSI